MNYLQPGLLKYSHEPNHEVNYSYRAGFGVYRFPYSFLQFSYKEWSLHLLK